MNGYNEEDEEQSLVEDLVTVYGSAGPQTLSPLVLMDRARAGLSMAYLQDLCSKLGVSLSEMSGFLHISLRTLQRYPDLKVLDIDLSSKLLLLTDLYAHGQDVMSAEGFRLWLRESVPILGGQTPLSMLDNPFGIRQVDYTLGQLEHGVFA